MKEIEIVRYDPSMSGEWDAFVEKSRNATFLFKRGYMDYHSDRFTDHSLLAVKGRKIIALLPANIREDEWRRVLQSHGGLTYGGWVLGERHPDAVEMLEIFAALRAYCLQWGIQELDYKPVPFIYCEKPSEEERYALFRNGARLSECNISCCINLRSNPGFNKQQMRNFNRGSGMLTEIREESNVRQFHTLLSDCLAERHGVKPVHSAEELQMLRNRFPENIHVFILYAGEDPECAHDGAAGEGTVPEERKRMSAEAGVCVFDTGRVAHAQYICSGKRGREKGLLTRLFRYLIEERFKDCEYFDFGICNEDQGEYLNSGLYRQKASLGGSGVAYERYILKFSRDSLA